MTATGELPMTATTEQPRSATQPRAWLPVAAALFGIGWGANQITPMLLVYRHALGLGTGTLEAVFGVYALGLIPGLLIAGPLSDARGRRAVVVPAVAMSLVASVLLTGATLSVVLLFAGRLLAGVSSGAAFGAGTAWLRETSLPPLGTASDHTAARRAAVAMTAGFALGPLVSGIVAQWAPSPTVLPYLPHLAVMAVVWVLLRRAPETVTAGRRRVPRLSTPGLRSRRFRTVVAPMAPWVFAAPAIAFALLPSLAGAGQAANGIALTAAIAALCALAGILVQPLARRLDLRPGRNRAAAAGLLVLAAGLVLGAVTAHAREVWLLVPSAIVLGGAYGMCLVAGLVEVQRLAGSNGAAGLTAIYYALTYLGFAAPYLIVLGTHLASYTVLLAVAALLALGTAALITRTSASEQAADEQTAEGASRSQAAG
jgi:Major Facilitator Superfamily